MRASLLIMQQMRLHDGPSLRLDRKLCWSWQYESILSVPILLISLLHSWYDIVILFLQLSPQKASLCSSFIQPANEILES